jgi:serine/threonine protein kinase
MSAERPLEGIESCRDVDEYHEPVEPWFGPELRPGQVLDGRFLIGGPLSRSGMATIYQAQDLHDHHQLVAIKVPHLQYEADPAFFSRFEREEQIGQKLDHPFILKFIPVARKSRPYLVTEYLRGWTLAHLLNAMRPLPEKDALKIASLICEGIGHMHSHGVIHRDLKPGNIMMCSDRSIRIMDFGIASNASSRRITLAGLSSTMGTPDYMSPEQVRNRRCDERTDIYSLGAILYEMLAGPIPFRDDNPWVAMNNRVSGDPVAPRKINPAITPQAEEIVLRALQRDPGQRFQTAIEFKAALDSPAEVKVTGICERLEKPRWQLGLRTTPVLAGALLGAAFISLQVLLFFLLKHFMKR